MAESLLQVRNLFKRFGGLVATDDVSLDIAAGEVHALIGPNGAGKTTLLAQLSGQLASDAGQVLLAGRDITRLPMARRVHLGMARSFQITSVLGELTAADNVALAVQACHGHSFRFWRPAAADATLRAPANDILEQVGLASVGTVLAASLSHGEQRQLEIAMALASNPRLMLLDEPTAGMAPQESAQMVAFLQRIKGERAVLLIEHDMDAVFALADRITVLVDGHVIATGTPQAIRGNPEVRRAYLGED